jgi:hypothetical protein
MSSEIKSKYTPTWNSDGDKLIGACNAAEANLMTSEMRLGAAESKMEEVANKYLGVRYEYTKIFKLLVGDEDQYLGYEARDAAWAKLKELMAQIVQLEADDHRARCELGTARSENKKLKEELSTARHRLSAHMVHTSCLVGDLFDNARAMFDTDAWSKDQMEKQRRGGFDLPPSVSLNSNGDSLQF